MQLTPTVRFNREQLQHSPGVYFGTVDSIFSFYLYKDYNPNFSPVRCIKKLGNLN